MNFVVEDIFYLIIIAFVVFIGGIGASLIIWRNVIYCLIRDVLRDVLKDMKEDNYYIIKGAFKTAIKEVYKENNNNDK